VYAVTALWIPVALVTLLASATSLSAGHSSEDWFGVVGGLLMLIAGGFVVAGMVIQAVSKRRGQR
jgi:hypothetical protein